MWMLSVTLIISKLFGETFDFPVWLLQLDEEKINLGPNLYLLINVNNKVGNII
jgi:hypothetical protein